MFNNRKAQGLSVHTIIVAIIGLIILVAIVLMISGKLTGFDEGVKKISGDITKTCTDVGGFKKPKTECDKKTGATSLLSSDTIGSSDVCCSA